MQKPKRQSSSCKNRRRCICTLPERLAANHEARPRTPVIRCHQLTATEQNGYFFRQYPLVDNGLLVENELKNKSVRRGLCELEGRVVVVESQTPESLHDFAQALVDIGVSNAIYLVGSSAVAWCMDPDGNGTKMGLWDERVYKNISFIVWPNPYP